MKRNNKGFTLAELLIVVAIIAVLVAVAIPVFTTQLEKSKEAVDLSNLRAGYAEAVTGQLTGEASTKYTSVTIKQGTAGWTGDNANAVIGEVTVGTDSVLKSVSAGDTVTVGCDANGKATFSKL